MVTETLVWVFSVDSESMPFISLRTAAISFLKLLYPNSVLLIQMVAHEQAPTTPSDANAESSPLVEDIVELIATVEGVFHDVKWLTKEEVTAWVTKLLRSALAANEKQMVGEVRAVLPLSESVGGRRLKIILQGVPTDLLNSIIIPAFQATGSVFKVPKQDSNPKRKFQTERKQQMEAIGDYKGTMNFFENLVRLRGEGEPGPKQRKFAENAANAVERSQRVSSSGMKQMKEDVRDTVD